MYELISYIICSIGILYLFCRITSFMKVFSGFFGKSEHKKVLDSQKGISRLCHCDFMLFEE